MNVFTHVHSCSPPCSPEHTRYVFVFTHIFLYMGEHGTRALVVFPGRVFDAYETIVIWIRMLKKSVPFKMGNTSIVGHKMKADNCQNSVLWLRIINHYRKHETQNRAFLSHSSSPRGIYPPISGHFLNGFSGSTFYEVIHGRKTAYTNAGDVFSTNDPTIVNKSRAVRQPEMRFYACADR